MVLLAGGMLQFKEGGEKVPSPNLKNWWTCPLLSSTAVLYKYVECSCVTNSRCSSAICSTYREREREREREWSISELIEVHFTMLILTSDFSSSSLLCASTGQTLACTQRCGGGGGGGVVSRGYRRRSIQQLSRQEHSLLQ